MNALMRGEKGSEYTHRPLLDHYTPAISATTFVQPEFRNPWRPNKVCWGRLEIERLIAVKIALALLFFLLIFIALILGRRSVSASASLNQTNPFFDFIALVVIEFHRLIDQCGWFDADDQKETLKSDLKSDGHRIPSNAGISIVHNYTGLRKAKLMTVTQCVSIKCIDTHCRSTMFTHCVIHNVNWMSELCRPDRPRDAAGY